MIENDLGKTVLRSIYDSFYYHTTSPTLDKLALFAQRRTKRSFTRGF